MPDTAAIKRYSEQLEALNEPIIWQNRSKDDIFRFTWLRSADHPIAIRIVKHGNQYILYWKEADGTGAGDPGKLITNRQKTIDKATYIKFRKQLGLINLCKLDTNRYIPAGTDGSRWILDGIERSVYQIDDAWSPGITNDLYKACDYLIRLTDLAIPPEKKY